MEATAAPAQASRILKYYQIRNEHENLFFLLYSKHGYGLTSARHRDTRMNPLQRRPSRVSSRAGRDTADMYPGH